MTVSKLSRTSFLLFLILIGSIIVFYSSCKQPAPPGDSKPKYKKIFRWCTAYMPVTDSFSSGKTTQEFEALKQHYINIFQEHNRVNKTAFTIAFVREELKFNNGEQMIRVHVVVKNNKFSSECCTPPPCGNPPRYDEECSGEGLPSEF
jgi:hypothetical protein